MKFIEFFGAGIIRKQRLASQFQRTLSCLLWEVAIDSLAQFILTRSESLPFTSSLLLFSILEEVKRHLFPKGYLLLSVIPLIKKVTRVEMIPGEY